MKGPFFRRGVVISGIGQSEIGRSIGDPYRLTIDACVAAIEDAGLAPSDIDGLAAFPGSIDVPGLGPVGIVDIHEALRLNLGWYSAGFETMGNMGAIVTACAAVESGLATHVLCFATEAEGSAQKDVGRTGLVQRWGMDQDGRAMKFGGFDLSWSLPFGVPPAAPWYGMYATRHFHQYGTTREQLAQVPLTCRANAARNPKAIFRSPLTLDDYLKARLISSPLGMFDCDVPCDASHAFVISSAATAPDLRQPPVRIESVGASSHGRHSWDQVDDLADMGLRDAAEMMWSRTDLTPADVDVAQVYDGFSILALVWLEALGFCGKGEGGGFVENGRIAAGGELPINTHGGHLSAGRSHGHGSLHEACLQLGGEAGERQLPRAPEVAVVSSGGAATLQSCFLLTTS